MNLIPEKFRYLLAPEMKAVAYLATVMDDLSPQVTPVWFTVDGEHLLVNTAAGRVKDRNMQRRSRVSFLIVDPANSYKYIHLRAKVVKRAEDETLIHRLSEIYTGNPQFRIKPGDVRVTYTFLPDRVFTYDW